MAAIRSMLARVAKLEMEQVPPLLAKFGGEEGWAAFETDVDVGIAEERYDRELALVAAGLRRWFREGI